MLLKVAVLARNGKSHFLVRVYFNKLFAVFHCDGQRVEGFDIAFIVGRNLLYVRRGNVIAVTLIRIHRAYRHYIGVGKLFGRIHTKQSVGRIVDYGILKLIYRLVNKVDAVYILSPTLVSVIFPIEQSRALPIRPHVLFGGSAQRQVFALVEELQTVLAVIADAERKRPPRLAGVRIYKRRIAELSIAHFVFVLERKAVGVLFNAVVQRAQSGIFKLEARRGNNAV